MKHLKFSSAVCIFLLPRLVTRGIVHRNPVWALWLAWSGYKSRGSITGNVLISLSKKVLYLGAIPSQKPFSNLAGYQINQSRKHVTFFSNFPFRSKQCCVSIAAEISTHWPTTPATVRGSIPVTELFLSSFFLRKLFLSSSSWVFHVIFFSKFLSSPLNSDFGQRSLEFAELFLVVSIDAIFGMISVMKNVIKIVTEQKI